MDGYFMKAKEKLLLSLLAGLLAVMLTRPTMWWGVLFSPFSSDLICASVTEDAQQGWRWEQDGVVLRFKSLDILLSFLRGR